MQLSPLGSTGIQVSRLSLGGAQFGQQYGAISLADAEAVVAAALDAGVNLFDTSAYYGQGTSEEFLGHALQGRRDQVTICTKAGRLGRNEFDFSAAGMRTCFEGSLRRLRTDCVDILLAHDIEFADDFESVFTETAEVLHRLKAEGKCRFIGMSCYPLGLLKLAIERCQLDVVISYCHYSLQNRRLLTELMPVAEAHGVGVLNGSPLAMGLLTNQGPPTWNPAGEGVRAACRAAAEHCRARGRDISTLAMEFCFAERRIPSTISGASNLAELAANLAAIDEMPDPAFLTEVETILQPAIDYSWPNGNWQA
jgi:L-galactose dehydrogenase